MSKKLDLGKLEYFPLTLCKLSPTDMKDDTFELKNHVGKVKYKVTKKSDDIQLPPESLLASGKIDSPLLLYWITMYNEPFTQLVETLAGVYRSYYELVDIDEAFKDKVHIMIIVDGYEKLDIDFLINWEKAGIYNELKTKRFRAIKISPGSNEVIHKLKDLNFINRENMNDEIRVYGTNNVGHCFSRKAKFTDFFNSLPKEKAENIKINSYEIFEFMLGNDKSGRVKERRFFHLPMPVHFMIKHRNQGKIDSHKWFFKGFWEYMNPKYAQILDWGSIPLWNSISHIIMHMETKPQVGGACGEIEVLMPEMKENGNEISFWEGVLLRAQYIEYKLSHYLDKSTETLFGFVSVLPGAFSTFRWDAIKGAPLKEFLRGSTDEFGDVSCIQRCASANKYLAEDRIMCLEIIAKRNENYIIHYVPGAICLTDPPLNLNSLIKQRRRWFNGSLFASIHAIKHMWRVWGRGKWSWFRNMAFMILYLYLLIQMIVFFVIVGIFTAIFSIFIRSSFPEQDCLYAFSFATLLEASFIALLLGVLVISITVDIDWSGHSYTILSFLMGIFTLIMAGFSVIYAINGNATQIGIYLFITFLLSYLIPLILNWK
jgi:cellulose synthase/poly-beta-1,6-N-acetylglucosamine synthase-like glycosyltransferase